MADADLDVLIRKFAKQQHKTLTLAVKKQKDRYAALVARAKDADSKQRYRQLAKDTLEIGTAAIKRLQMSADNAAYSYARAIRHAAEAAKKADASAGKTKKPAKKTAVENSTKTKV